MGNSHSETKILKKYDIQFFLGAFFMFLNFFDFCVILNDMYFVDVIHIYNKKRSRFLLVGEPALWGMCVGYALFGGVLVVVDYDELADFGGDSQLACCSHE